jgi:predicted nucleic acid-binding protein
VIVLDASALVELLFQTATGKKVASILFKEKINIAAPELLPVETVEVLRKFLNSRELSTERANLAFQDLNDMPITLYPHHILLDRIWALRNNFSAYDAAYLALAENLKAPLLTSDNAFKKGFGKLHKVKVIYVK